MDSSTIHLLSIMSIYPLRSIVKKRDTSYLGSLMKLILQTGSPF